MAEALAALGVDHAMVVHGNDGLDEISLGASTSVVEVRNERLSEFEITPETFGLKPASPREFLTADLKEAAELLRRTLGGDPGPAQDVLALNAGAAIYVGGGADSMGGGVNRARAILAAGRALETVERMRAASHEDAGA
jgi:anthranilate phosphoribosyltransferase